MINTRRFEVPGTQISDVAIREPASGARPTELILLLHGFSLSGETMLKRLDGALPPEAVVIAPNGPYPIPEREKTPDGERWRVGFSWYFYDFATDEYYIDMRVARAMLREIVERSGYAELPRRIIGYSQGGYLAPFAALTIGGVSQVVGIASRFLADEIDEDLRERGGLSSLAGKLRMDSIHGERDEIVVIAPARESRAQLDMAGIAGSFTGLADVGHGIGEPMREALRRVLAEGRG